MTGPFTPRQVARALGLGESTVKRWCDKQLITSQVTAGGHRRISLEELCTYLRSTKQSILRPELLGLPANVGSSSWTIDRAVEQLTLSLLKGDEDVCRRIVMDLYLAGNPISFLCDSLIAKCFTEIGLAWECRNAEVYAERRACRIALRLLDGLRQLTQSPGAEAPLAIGGTPEGDYYDVANNMTELVLRNIGWRATVLGSNLPFSTLAAAIRDQQPRLLWLSCSHIDKEQQFLEGYSALFNEFGTNVAFVVGGRALRENLRKKMRYAAFCDGMRHLESFSQSLTSSGNLFADPV